MDKRLYPTENNDDLNKSRLISRTQGSSSYATDSPDIPLGMRWPHE